MKLLPVTLLAGGLLLGTPISSVLAQAPGSSPAAAKPKSLSSSDKPVARGILESLYLMDDLVTKVVHRRKDEPTLLPDAGWKALGEVQKLKNSLWGDVAPLVMASGDKMPGAISPKDKKRMEILAPAKADPRAARGRKDDKKLEYGAAWALLMNEEVKELGKLLEKASKSTDPQVTKISSSWSDSVKAIGTTLEPIVPAKK